MSESFPLYKQSRNLSADGFDILTAIIEGIGSRLLISPNLKINRYFLILKKSLQVRETLNNGLNNS